MQTTKLNQVSKQVIIEMFNMFENDDINLNQIETNLAIPFDPEFDYHLDLNAKDVQLFNQYVKDFEMQANAQPIDVYNVILNNIKTKLKNANLSENDWVVLTNDFYNKLVSLF